jgi:hypothetical protein
MKRLASFLTHTNLRRWSETKLAISTALAVVMCCSSVFAQSGAGSIQGTVTDSTGAVLPGASIHVVNQSTNVASDAKTNNVGFYQVPDLFTGTYTVSITASGMQTNQRTVELLVGQNAVINVALTAGAVTQKVEVKADAVQLVTTDSGVIASTLENQRINELPMNGRNIISQVNETTPGLESCPESSSCANGQSGPALEYETDGVTLANREFGGVHEGSTQMVDPDAIQEVRVETEVSGAQFAAPSTAIITTKSGTNQLHGSLFETARNNAFGIARSRSEQSNYVAPEYIRNEFGVSVGGPIVIPHVYNGRNKSFFFFAYERYSLAQVASQNESTPTAAMRQGDFSGLTNSSGVFQQLYDPATTASSTNCNGSGTANVYCRTPFANNKIPLIRESPTAAVLNAMSPMATNGNNPLVKSNLIGLVPELQVEPQITFRLDHEFNESNRAYVRYTQNISTSTTPRNDPVDESYSLAATASGGTIPYGASGISYDPDALYAAALGFTHIFSSSFFSETVLSQQWMGEQNYAGGAPFTNYESELGLPNNFGESGFPYVESIFQPFDGTQFQYGMTSIISQIDDNLTKTVGRHQLEFGGRFRHERFGSRPDETKDSINFDGQDTGLGNPSTYSTGTPAITSNTGQLNADEFLGGASSYAVNLQPPYQHLHDNEFDLYLQDNFHVRSNLTFNLGLRYEAHPAVWEGQGAMMGFDLKNDAIVTSAPVSQLISEGLTTQAIINNDELDGVKFETPDVAHLPSMLVKNYDFTWGPRFGAAWQPFSSKWGTVLRGGVGRYIYPIPIREGYRDINRNNPFTAGYSESYTSVQYAPRNSYLLTSAPNSSSGYSYATTLAGGGTPIMGVNTTNAINSNSLNAIAPGLSIVSINPDNPPTYTNEANFTIEQPLKWNSVLRVSYLYTHGTNLINYFYYNDHPSEYSWEVQTGTTTPASSAIGPTNVNTGEGPYDNVTYGSGSYQIQKSGWSNYNALQATYQKLYHNGTAWQVLYVWSKSMRTGGDFGGESAEEIDPYSAFVNSGPASVSIAPEGGTLIAPKLPPPPPAGTPNWGYYKALNRWENYMVDTNNPPQHLQFNGLIDLPFGKGKRWLSGSGRALNELVGGWQIAGAGRFIVTDFQITTTNWGPTNQLKVYKHNAPITDCRSGVCLKSNEWWNGYIAPTAQAGNICAGSLSTVVNGLPGNWASYQTPIDTKCSAPVNGKTVVDQYYDDNDVIVNGVTGQKANTVIGYGVVPSNNNNGASEGAIDVANPYGHTVLQGPMNWSADLSLFKVFPITERVFLRFNVDAFNVFNNQGLPNPSSTDGTVCTTPGGLGCSSYNTPRQIQLTGRLTF